MYFWDKHRIITRYYEALTKAICEKYDLTQMEYDTLMFLYNNPEYKTASDIVKVRKATKSHVSLTIASLEDKGLVARRPKEGSKKFIEIFIQDKASDVLYDGSNIQSQFLKDVFSDISEKEMDLFKRVFLKMCSNAEKRIKGLNL